MVDNGNVKMLIMVVKCIRGGICYSICRHAKDINKYMKDYDESKELSYLQCWDVNNLYDQAMPEKLPVNNFECIKETLQFNEDFVKEYNEENDEGYFLQVAAQYLKNLNYLHHDLSFLPEGLKIEKSKSLQLIYMIKVNMSYT